MPLPVSKMRFLYQRCSHKQTQQLVLNESVWQLSEPQLHKATPETVEVGSVNCDKNCRRRKARQRHETAGQREETRLPRDSLQPARVGGVHGVK